MSGSVKVNHPGGRPTVMTEAVLRKLEEAFAIGASDKEACFYADIVPSSLYEYQKKSPEFTERKDALKQSPVLLARQTVVKAIETDSALAMKYLERKRRNEFASRTELTGKDGEPVMPIPADTNLVMNFLETVAKNTKR